MKTLILSSALALGLIFTGSAQAGTAVYNSKTTQNASFATAHSGGGAFDGTCLSSKAGSRLIGPSQEEVATLSVASGSALAINTTYNSKTKQLVTFAPSFRVSHLNSTVDSTQMASAEKPAGKSALQSGSDVAMK
jgi:hypothetical protein